MPVEIQVKSDPSTTQPKGDWVVKVGSGRGGSIVSRHRKKSAAVKRGRREGRKRKDQGDGAVLKVQNKSGRWKTEARYGKARQRSGGLLGDVFGKLV